MTTTLAHRAARRLAGVWLLGAVLGGCGSGGDEVVHLAPLGGLALLDRPGGEVSGEAERLVARAIWGIAPAGEDGLVRGSAVAVAADTLLASCAVAPGGEVRLVRRSAERRVRVAAAGPDRRVCAFRPPGVQLQPVRAYRPFADLRVGETVLAAVSRTSRSFALARGSLTAKGDELDPYLETTLAPPPGTASAALFDAFGNLVGFGAQPAGGDSLLVAAPVPPALAGRLAEARLAGTPPLHAAQDANRPPRAVEVTREVLD